jgi:formylglycine-generating enzyme required for sulfatase activity
VAWYNNNSNGSTHPVGQKDSNIFGLYDMHGNVFQWCQDWFEGDYHGKSPAEDPGGPTKGTYRVLRGGCWGHSRFDCRSPRRAADIPDARYGTCGFRVVVVGAPSRTP